MPAFITRNLARTLHHDCQAKSIPSRFAHSTDQTREIEFEVAVMLSSISDNISSCRRRADRHKPTNPSIRLWHYEPTTLGTPLLLPPPPPNEECEERVASSRCSMLSDALR
jgi:hypothetical protein